MEFFEEPKRKLRAFLKDKETVRTAIIYGNVGVGKSTAIQDVLCEMSFLKVTFEKECSSAYESLRKIADIPICEPPEVIAESLSSAYSNAGCILFENFELCERDSFVLISKVINFRCNNKLPAVSIIEWNTNLIPPLPDDWHECIQISFHELKENQIKRYLATIMNSRPYLINRLTQIAEGNLLKLHLAINILLQQGILNKQDSRKYYYTGRQFSESLLLLYLDLFKELNEKIQHALQMTSPFEENIYALILKQVFSDCAIIDAYLDEISAYQSFLFRKGPDNKDMFCAVYSFASKEARDAITEATPNLYLKTITAQLYQHLEALRKNSTFYHQLNAKDRICLLTLLTKIRNHTLTINHLPYFTELMKCHKDASAYWAVIKTADAFLNAHVLNTMQIHKTQPDFFRLYLSALLSVAEYSRVISYQDTFKDWDIKLVIAQAHYNNGSPQKALDICHEIEQLPGQFPHGEVFSLEASAYDWLGDCKQSLAAFKRALRHLNKNEYLKFSLYKKYSLYIDFALPECRTKMEEAITYFAAASRRQYAEALHNYGTELIISFSKDGLNYLDQSRQVLCGICDKEIYNPLNSIAIHYCLCGNFQKAILIWKNIHIEDIQIDFCRLAIQNNLLCAYIKIGDLISANSLRTNLKKQIHSLVPVFSVEKISVLRPDIQHQIRQFYLNCALLSLEQDKTQQAFNFYMSALECSKYHSTMLHFIRSEIHRLQSLQKQPFLQKLLKKAEEKGFGKPNALENFFAQNRMYFCIIMFWGDY